MPTRPMKLPPEIARLAPRREDFPDQESYEEAKAAFQHRVKHLARSKASHDE